MGTAIDIVSLGEPLYEFSQVPGENRKYLQGFGGDTSNASIAAARQGAQVAYVTRLGDDEFGKQFLALWRRKASTHPVWASIAKRIPRSTSFTTGRKVTSSAICVQVPRRAACIQRIFRSI